MIEEPKAFEEFGTKVSDQSFRIEARGKDHDYGDVPVLVGHGLEGKREQVQKDKRVRAVQNPG